MNSRVVPPFLPSALAFLRSDARNVWRHNQSAGRPALSLNVNHVYFVLPSEGVILCSSLFNGKLESQSPWRARLGRICLPAGAPHTRAPSRSDCCLGDWLFRGDPPSQLGPPPPLRMVPSKFCYGPQQFPLRLRPDPLICPPCFLLFSSFAFFVIWIPPNSVERTWHLAV